MVEPKTVYVVLDCSYNRMWADELIGDVMAYESPNIRVGKRKLSFDDACRYFNCAGCPFDKECYDK